MEGRCCSLAARGYSRDGKKGGPRSADTSLRSDSVWVGADGPGLAEAVDGVGALQHRQRHISDGSAARSGAALGTRVRVAVDAEVGMRAVRRLGEEVAAEERVDLEGLARQRVGDRRVVGERDAEVGAQVAERLADSFGEQPGTKSTSCVGGIAPLAYAAAPPARA